MRNTFIAVLVVVLAALGWWAASGGSSSTTKAELQARPAPPRSPEHIQQLQERMKERGTTKLKLERQPDGSLKAVKIGETPPKPPPSADAPPAAESDGATPAPTEAP